MATATVKTPEPVPPPIEVVLELSAAEAAVVLAFVGQYNSGPNCAHVIERNTNSAAKLLDLPGNKSEVKRLCTDVYLALDNALVQAGRRERRY